MYRESEYYILAVLTALPYPPSVRACLHRAFVIIGFPPPPFWLLRRSLVQAALPDPSTYPASVSRAKPPLRGTTRNAACRPPFDISGRDSLACFSPKAVHCGGRCTAFYPASPRFPGGLPGVVDGSGGTSSHGSGGIDPHLPGEAANGSIHQR